MIISSAGQTIKQIRVNPTKVCKLIEHPAFNRNNGQISITKPVLHLDVPRVDDGLLAVVAEDDEGGVREDADRLGQLPVLHLFIY